MQSLLLIKQYYNRFSFTRTDLNNLWGIVGYFLTTKRTNLNWFLFKNLNVSKIRQPSIMIFTCERLVSNYPSWGWFWQGSACKYLMVLYSLLSSKLSLVRPKWCTSPPQHFYLRKLDNPVLQELLSTKKKYYLVTLELNRKHLWSSNKFWSITIQIWQHNPVWKINFIKNS